MKTKTSALIIGLMLTALTNNAFAETVLATEPFVRGGVANAKAYAETIVKSATETSVANAKAYAEDIVKSATDTLNASIAKKQDTLPTATGNDGKVLGVVDVAGTLGWIDQSETDVSGKADLQTGAVVGNVATMDASGQYVDSNTALTDLATDTEVSTAVAGKADLQTGAVVGNVATMDASGQYVDSNTALTDLATTSSVAGKADLQTGAIVGNVATMDANGQYVDSNTALTDLATTTDVGTALADKENLIIGGITNTGKVIIGTETGWSWASTTGDTYTE